MAKLKHRQKTFNLRKGSSDALRFLAAKTERTETEVLNWAVKEMALRLGWSKDQSWDEDDLNGEPQP